MLVGALYTTLVTGLKSFEICLPLVCLSAPHFTTVAKILIFDEQLRRFLSSEHSQVEIASGNGTNTKLENGGFPNKLSSPFNALQSSWIKLRLRLLAHPSIDPPLGCSDSILTLMEKAENQMG